MQQCTDSDSRDKSVLDCQSGEAVPANHARTPRHLLEADHKNHITRTGLGSLSGQCPRDQSFFESETMSRRTFISSLRSRSQRECDTRMTNCIGREIDICKTVPCIRRGRPYRSNQLFPDDRSRSFLPRFCAKPWGGRGNPIATSLILSANASMIQWLRVFGITSNKVRRLK